MKQETLMGEVKEVYFCANSCCSWYGIEITEDGEFEICPKCENVCYSDSEVREEFVRRNSNIYPNMVKKWRKYHKLFF